MKRKILLIAIPLAALVVLVLAMGKIMSVPLEKEVSVRGYTICIPENWSSDSKGNFYEKKGNLAGSFTLIDVESENPPRLENAKSVISRDFLSNFVSKYEFSQNGKDAVIYYIKNLPNPEPYAAEIVFYNNYISKRMAEKIYGTFQIPVTGTNPPKKNISINAELQESENAVIITDGEVSDVLPLSRFSEALSEKKSFSIDILEYTKEEKETVLKSWYSLESDNGIGYMYSYYQKDDGTYTYDNNPVIFDKLSKSISDEDKTTTYILKAENKEDVKLVRFSLDRYRDNAKELVALKTDKADSEHVSKVMDKILSSDEQENMEVSVDGNTATVKFGEGVEADEADSYAQAAVIFSLAENIDSVTVSYADGKKYTYTKQDVNSNTKNEVEKAADSEGEFLKYAEELKKSQAQSGQNGEIVYSGSVVISYNTMVTHPDTGEKVAIGPYAEARGYGRYLGKAISCVIRRSGSGYIATASCGGSVIASYPLNGESDLNWAINMINSYS